MIIKELPLKGAYTVTLEPHKDQRGAFARTYCEREFTAAIGPQKPFVQMNHSWNERRGTLRGMHYQNPPFAEVKYIRCVSGAVLDVIIDIRQGSPTYLQHAAVELSAQNLTGIYVPEGFSHGFMTLEDNTQLIYHHTEFYAPGHEGGFRWNDPVLGIEWPFEPVVMSDKDEVYSLINSE